MAWSLLVAAALLEIVCAFGVAAGAGEDLGVDLHESIAPPPVRLLLAGLRE
jgi:hypothetical protein